MYCIINSHKLKLERAKIKQLLLMTKSTKNKKCDFVLNLKKQGNGILYEMSHLGLYNVC